MKEAAIPRTIKVFWLNSWIQRFQRQLPPEEYCFAMLVTMLNVQTPDICIGAQTVRIVLMQKAMVHGNLDGRK